MPAREEDAYVHEWKLGDMVVWDNFRTMHSAYGHLKKYPRVMNSLQISSTMKLGHMLREGSYRAAAMT